MVIIKLIIFYGWAVIDLLWFCRTITLMIKISKLKKGLCQQFWDLQLDILVILLIEFEVISAPGFLVTFFQLSRPLL